MPRDSVRKKEREEDWAIVLGWLRKNYNWIDGNQCQFAQTGEPYVIITQSGIKNEGEIRYDKYASSSSGLSMCEWAERIDEYALSKGLLGKKANLYWRSKPELFYKAKFGWNIYSRLLISDKAELVRNRLNAA